MPWLNQYPLRITIPLSFLFIGLLSSAIFYYYSAYKISQAHYEESLYDLRQGLVEKQAMVQSLLRRHDSISLKKMMQTNLSDPNVVKTLIVDKAGNILYSSSLNFQGNLQDNAQLTYLYELFSHNKDKEMVSTYHVDDTPTLYGIAPLYLSGHVNHLRPQIDGYYLEHRDVTERVKNILVHEKNKTLIEISLFLSAFFFSLVLFYVTVAKRLQKILTAIENFHGYEVPHLRLDGKDEISTLGTKVSQLFERIHVYQDSIEEQKAQAQNALYALKEQKLALDAHAIVSITTPDGKIIYVNDKFMEISGYSLEELLGKDHRIINSAYHSQDFWKEMYRTLQQGEVWHQEVRNRRKDGKIYWVDSTIVPFYNKDGSLESYISIRTDITQNKLNEEKILSTLELLEATLDATENGMLVVNAKGKLIHSNHEALALFELSLEPDVSTDQQLLFGQIKSKMCDPQAFEQLLWQVADEQRKEIHTSFELLNGTHLECVSKPIVLDEMPIARLWSFYNITQKVQTQEALVNAKNSAEETSRSKSAFLASMSHEIRTPMNGILGFVEQLSKQEKDEKRIKQFEIIRQSGRQLLGILNDILDLSKIESGQMDIENHPNNLEEVFSAPVNIFTQMAQEKNISLEYTIENALPECVLCDPIRIRQVLVNLLSNAIKFTPEQGKVQLVVSYENKQLHVSVKDSGIGIAQSNIMKIFEAFKQEDDTTTRKFGGTGLGLNICAKLIDMMQGSLQVDSVQCEGSHFYFAIPLQVCDALPGQSDSIEEEHPCEDLIKGMVLIVEDNKTNQLLLGIILEEAGIEYQLANDGLEAVEMFKAHKIDLILMDENMPNMNGIEATKQIRNYEAALNLEPTPIVAVTANAMKEDRQRFIDAGMDEYLAKPYEEEDIIKVVYRFLHHG